MRIAQKDDYQGDGWWNWAVWIAGSSRELDSIAAVTYMLHPTFPEPERKITDRSSKFRLSASGWGGFNIVARVALKNGTIKRLKHELALYYPPGVVEGETVELHIDNATPGTELVLSKELKRAILEASPDAVVKSKAPLKPKKGGAATARVGVQLVSPLLPSITRGVQDWLGRNPHVTVDLVKGKTVVASAVGAGSITKALYSLKS